MLMLAQGSPETAKTFIERLPDILKAVAENPLGFVALIIMVLAVFAAVMFGKSNVKFRFYAFVMVVVCALGLGLLVVLEAGKTKPAMPAAGNAGLTNPVVVVEPPKECQVEGHVYNADKDPAVGIQNVLLSYVSATAATAQPVPIARSAPDGHFSFNCEQIKPEHFPIRLRLVWKTVDGQERVCDTEDALLFGSNREFNLYVSPGEVATHFKQSTNVFRLTSAKLFQNNFRAMTTATNNHAAINSILTVPANQKIRRIPIGIH